ncbi:insulinase family protein [Hymenobacter sp. BT507]|uniref:Insulinase family protein n=1 Tax=Hymenobacter citatus TaxID=2763506 RepID=A0ABR7MNG7_9BACT|nr:pitrilysin family protein [Hymenobacter citatus]MBC6612600.1 insulinase family protein [Hymenobacter citatus]
MLDRTVAPPVQPLASVTLPAADVLSLPNGARLHVLRNSAQPVVRLQIVFPAGKWYESGPSVSLLTARMLLEGTHTRTARQIADTVAFYGASLECEQGFDRATLTLYCLTRHLEQLLPLILDVATEAVFPEPEFDLLKTRTIQNVRIERQKNNYLASERFSRNLYGPTYPYGVTFEEELFQKIPVEAVRTFYQSAYRMSAAELFVCGDIDSAQQQLIANLFGQIQAQTDAPIVITPLSPVSAPLQDQVVVADSLQSSLRIGRLWVAPTHPDYHPLQVLVKVLGGYFGSRLMKNIREDKGFTYGIHASVSLREHATSLVIGTDVNAASTEAAMKEIRYELTQLQQDLIPEEELQTVKNYMLGKFANELSTVFEQCDKYKSLVFLNLPATYYEDFLHNINAVKRDQLRILAQQYLSPEGMIEVIAGPHQ